MRVDVQGMVVHGQQAEEVIVRFGDRLARPVLVGGAHLELLEIAPELHPSPSAQADCVTGLLTAPRSASTTSVTGGWSPASPEMYE